MFCLLQKVRQFLHYCTSLFHAEGTNISYNLQLSRFLFKKTDEVMFQFYNFSFFKKQPHLENFTSKGSTSFFHITRKTITWSPWCSHVYAFGWYYMIQKFSRANLVRLLWYSIILSLSNYHKSEFQNNKLNYCMLMRGVGMQLHFTQL